MNIDAKSEYILQRLDSKKNWFTKIFDDIKTLSEKLSDDKSDFTIIKLESPSKEEVELREENFKLLQKYIENLEKIIEVKESEI